MDHSTKSHRIMTNDRFIFNDTNVEYAITRHCNMSKLLIDEFLRNLKTAKKICQI